MQIDNFTPNSVKKSELIEIDCDTPENEMDVMKSYVQTILKNAENVQSTQEMKSMLQELLNKLKNESEDGSESEEGDEGEVTLN